MTSRVPATASSFVASRSLRKTSSRKTGAVALYMCTVARGAPVIDSTVRAIRSVRAWVSTEIVTSSGTPPSTTERTKSKSIWLAEGKPISISLKPIFTSRSNIRRLRRGSIGSMSAWLPSRRSVDSHRGALVMRAEGQVRSGRSTPAVSRNGRYLFRGIAEGCCALRGCWSCRMSVGPYVVGSAWPAHQPPRRETGLEGLVAATKEQGPLPGHAHEDKSTLRTRGAAGTGRTGPSGACRSEASDRPRPDPDAVRSNRLDQAVARIRLDRVEASRLQIPKTTAEVTTAALKPADEEVRRQKQRVRVPVIGRARRAPTELAVTHWPQHLPVRASTIARTPSIGAITRLPTVDRIVGPRTCWPLPGVSSRDSPAPIRVTGHSPCSPFITGQLGRAQLCGWRCTRRPGRRPPRSCSRQGSPSLAASTPTPPSVRQGRSHPLNRARPVVSRP